ncbi:hypothetical protein WN943_000968 [Citrus x changshan-huyou]
MSMDLLDDLELFIDTFERFGRTCLRSLNSGELASKEELARVDASKSIDCYKHEINWHLEEEVARDHINDLVRQTWKKVNVNRAYEDSVEFEHNRSQKENPRMKQRTKNSLARS